MFGVHDQLSVDFLDKMPEKQRDLKMICASAIDDFLKVLSSQPKKINTELCSHGGARNDRKLDQDDQLVINVHSGPPKVILEADKEESTMSARPLEKFLISSKPYIRKCTSQFDKAVNTCWETHYRFKAYDLFVTT